MKPNHHRNIDTHATFESNASRVRALSERGMHAINARPPPAVACRRYPSLSDDGEPCFPRFSWTRRAADKAVSATDYSPATDASSSLFPVRVVALLAIIAVIVALVANAE
jgi:hypothetical protein